MNPFEEKASEAMTKKIDENTEVLIREFFKHYDEVKIMKNEDVDKRIVFEGWAIQKISGLQMVVLDLQEQIFNLTVK